MALYKSKWSCTTENEIFLRAQLIFNQQRLNLSWKTIELSNYNWDIYYIPALLNSCQHCTISLDDDLYVISDSSKSHDYHLVQCTTIDTWTTALAWIATSPTNYIVIPVGHFSILDFGGINRCEMKFRLMNNWRYVTLSRWGTYPYELYNISDSAWAFASTLSDNWSDAPRRINIIWYTAFSLASGGSNDF